MSALALGRGLRATAAVARVTVAEAVRSRVVLGLVLGLGLALAGLGAQASGDGTEAGRVRSFLAAAFDVTWALLALAAVFLSTQSLARELEDGRAVPVALAPVPRGLVLVGKWLGLVTVLGFVLVAATGGAAGFSLARAHLATPEGRSHIETEVLVGREAHRAPKLLLHPGFLDEAPRPGESKAHYDQARRALTRARARLEQLEKEGALPSTLRRQEALNRLIQDEAVKILSVGRGQQTEWYVGPIAPRDVSALALRYRYRALGVPAGRGPRGVFAIEVFGNTPIEKEVVSSPDTYHELPAPGGLLAVPTVRAAVDGIVGQVREAPGGRAAVLVPVDGQDHEVPRSWKVVVGPGAVVHRGDALATSDRVVLRVTYRNVDDEGVIVVFPSEGVEVLVQERGFAENLLAALLVTLGRLAFVLAVGLALTTFLDGKVAALATLFLLVVAASHGFLEDAVGPIVVGAQDNVFGLVDAPVKALLRAVLFVLPDLGKQDPSEALASGRAVAGALESVGVLAGASGSLALALGSWVLGRREIGGGR